ncbi:MAG: cupin domain-containing protein [Promethearchaeota archaeon]|nr:MAG: cupin domain-containing protein [Candidatus Lokiarchaeota archaeon]
MIKGPVNKDEIQGLKALAGIFRKTLAYNEDLMLCFFMLEKDAEIPLHDHESHQIGFVIKGKIKFITDEREFIANAGDSYVFDSWEKHGAKILEYSEVVEVFNPSRDDYK